MNQTPRTPPREYEDMTTASEFPSVVCAEHIAALSVLHNVPLLPSSNKTNPCFTEKMDRKRILSFDQERRITGALSFLAGVSDSSENVAAVCIQEVGHVTDNKSLRLLFAVNQDTAKHNTYLIEELKTGFEAVLAPLEHTMKKGSDEDSRAALGKIEEKVLLAIVTMCKGRILGRLRLVSSNRTGPGGQRQRQPFKDLLRDITESLKKMTGQDEILDAIKNVTSLFSNLASHQVVSEIYNLVLGLSRLSKLPGLYEAISAIPNTKICPSSRENFVNIVTKVTRYHEVCHLLCGMASQRELALVRMWTVMHAELPPSAFQRPVVPEREPDLTSLIADASGTAKPWPESEIKAIFSLLGDEGHDSITKVSKPQNALNVQETFQRQARNCRKKGRIHAEIQLLAYCELRRELSSIETIRETVPRVIRSHKAACYLCNLFITECFQKTYFTSRSHGRLYPGWRLPQCCFSKDVYTMFNAILAKTIKESMETLKTRGEKTKYPQPAESELTLLLAPSSLVRAETKIETDGAGDAPTGVEDGQQEELGAVFGSKTDRDITEVEEKDAGQATPASPPEASQASRTDKSQHPSATIANVHRRSRGHVRVNDATISSLYRIGDLELQVEYARQDDKRHLYFMAERLTGAEVGAKEEQLGIDSVLKMTDIDRLRPGDETTASINEQGYLYLAVTGGVYRVSLVFA